MITKPETTCPRCGGKLTALEVIDVTRHAESVTYYCECPCGAASLTSNTSTSVTVSPAARFMVVAAILFLQ